MRPEAEQPKLPTPGKPKLADAAGPVLTALARQAISEAFQALPKPATPELEFLSRPGASFVTLTQDGQLRGCIGTLEAHRPLGADIRSNARAAAFFDPRFPPLRADELDRTRIEVSVLSVPEPIQFSDRADLVAQLRPGVDGLILDADQGHATFLPQVWDQLPEPEVFLRHLLRKAGLPAQYWGPDVRVARYVVTAFEEDFPPVNSRGATPNRSAEP
jgi:AmmeMemoRadiSam system protein A